MTLGKEEQGWARGESPDFSEWSPMRGGPFRDTHSSTPVRVVGISEGPTHSDSHVIHCSGKGRIRPSDPLHNNKKSSRRVEADGGSFELTRFFEDGKGNRANNDARTEEARRRKGVETKT